MSYDVFLSYSHKDKAIADGICANLEAAGQRCWIAPRDIGPGEDWPTAIANGIAACRVMVLVFSQNSNMSDEVSRELYLAANSKLIIIPFIIENVKPEAGKAYYMGRTHWLDAMNPPTQEQIGQLIERINSLIQPIDTEGKIARSPSPVPATVHRPPVNRKQAWVVPTVAMVVVAALAIAGILVVPKLKGTAQPVSTQELTLTSSPQPDPQTTPLSDTQAPATPSPDGTAATAYLYREDFNTAEFDGTLPPNMAVDPNQCLELKVVQENGSLAFDAPANINLSCFVHFNLGFAMVLSDVKAVEFAIRISPETPPNQRSYGFILGNQDDSQKSLYFVCGLNDYRAGCGIKKEQQDIYRTKDVKVKLGDMATFRIEVLDPDKMAFRIAVNGETIGEYSLPSADVPAYKDLFYNVGGGPSSNGKTTGPGLYLMDYISIEQR